MRSQLRSRRCFLDIQRLIRHRGIRVEVSHSDSHSGWCRRQALFTIMESSNRECPAARWEQRGQPHSRQHESQKSQFDTFGLMSLHVAIVRPDRHPF